MTVTLIYMYQLENQLNPLDPHAQQLNLYFSHTNICDGILCMLQNKISLEIKKMHKIHNYRLLSEDTLNPYEKQFLKQS